MKHHRFYMAGSLTRGRVRVSDRRLLHQWRKVLRAKPGQEVILFNDTYEAIYQINELSLDQAQLQFVEDRQRQLPPRTVYLVWSLLKRDKNDWIIQKATELGVTHFLPVQADRCLPADISHVRLERWHKIAVEASEQSGRSDIPSIAEPQSLAPLLNQLRDKKVLLYQTEQGSGMSLDIAESEPAAVCIGPEGGWSDEEHALFHTMGAEALELSAFTLRAETAAIVASAHLAQ